MSPASAPQPHSPPKAPVLELVALDTLWLQVTGTVCNLACRHCFISCGPKNVSHPFMSVEQVRDAVESAVGHGVREFYFTGGEPFMHPAILELIELALARGPLSILTNGVLLDPRTCRSLREIFDGARYSLDLRVSLDGTTPAQNDPIRGRGTFVRIIEGLRNLAAAGLNPVLTVTEVGESSAESREEFRALLRGLGLDRPRLKFLAPFRIGREARRGRGYRDDERLEVGDLRDDEAEILQCGSCRAVTAKGWYPCPILVEHPAARMGDTIADAVAPIELRHAACYTCHVDGVSCRT
jgi:MoaA/NifB/PqqE/SkfB family radical SAM enzyme